MSSAKYDEIPTFFVTDEDEDTILQVVDCVKSVYDSDTVYYIDEDGMAYNVDLCTEHIDSLDEISSDENDLTKVQYCYKWNLPIMFDEDGTRRYLHLMWRRCLLDGMFDGCDVTFEKFKGKYYGV